MVNRKILNAIAKNVVEVAGLSLCSKGGLRFNVMLDLKP